MESEELVTIIGDMIATCNWTVEPRLMILQISRRKFY
jgi:hypothetical protein